MVGVLIFVAFVPLTLAFPQQQTGLSTRIVEGSSATISEFPHIVQVNQDGYPMCGGSIISESWVVTACHCLEGLTAVNVSIRAGTDESSTGGVVIQASDIYLHPNYDDAAIDYDIALIKLASALSFGSTISPVSLADKTTAEGTMAVVYGWGYLADSTDSTGSTQLQKVSLPVLSEDECTHNITARMLCAGYSSGTESPCYGDSGGPLAVNNTLIGIVSYGYGCYGISIYTNVYNLHDWVTSIASI